MESLSSSLISSTSMPLLSTKYFLIDGIRTYYFSVGNVMFNVVTIILIGVSIDMHYILEGYELSHTHC